MLNLEILSEGNIFIGTSNSYFRWLKKRSIDPGEYESFKQAEDDGSVRLKRDVPWWSGDNSLKCEELDPGVVRVIWSKNDGEYNQEGNTIKVEFVQQKHFLLYQC